MRTLQRRNSAAQTTVGVVLVIGLVIAGSTVVVALGNQALDDTRENSGLAQGSSTRLTDKRWTELTATLAATK